MDASQVLLEEAKGLVLRADNRAMYLKEQLEEIQARRDAIEAERREINSAAQRLLNYQPRIGAEYQCPGCWIDHGKQAPLSGVPGTDQHNILRCDACRKDWRIPLR
jgi:hypothetical protein